MWVWRTDEIGPNFARAYIGRGRTYYYIGLLAFRRDMNLDLRDSGINGIGFHESRSTQPTTLTTNL